MCNHNCYQGRRCDCAPPREPLSVGEAWVLVLIVVLGGAISIAGISTIAGYLWGLLQ